MQQNHSLLIQAPPIIFLKHVSFSTQTAIKPDIYDNFATETTLYDTNETWNFSFLHILPFLYSSG